MYCKFKGVETPFGYPASASNCFASVGLYVEYGSFDSGVPHDELGGISDVGVAAPPYASCAKAVRLSANATARRTSTLLNGAASELNSKTVIFADGVP